MRGLKVSCKLPLDFGKVMSPREKDPDEPAVAVGPRSRAVAGVDCAVLPARAEADKQASQGAAGHGARGLSHSKACGTRRDKEGTPNYSRTLWIEAAGQEGPESRRWWQLLASRPSDPNCGQDAPTKRENSMTGLRQGGKAPMQAEKAESNNAQSGKSSRKEAASALGAAHWAAGDSCVSTSLAPALASAVALGLPSARRQGETRPVGSALTQARLCHRVLRAVSGSRVRSGPALPRPGSRCCGHSQARLQPPPREALRFPVFLPVLQIQLLQAGGDSFPLTGSSGTVLGMALRSHDRSTKPLYISVGHKMGLETAVRLTHRCCRFRIPEPVRQVGGHGVWQGGRAPLLPTIFPS
ncbi:uncharacterized protein LOC142861890 [Microcebus murinus]|uniref:uncharacterized protein LOC142861890 n=1 Tax=Microcebus murinus TaxID=30608 RepID=UPI003F6B1D5F